MQHILYMTIFLLQIYMRHKIYKNKVAGIIEMHISNLCGSILCVWYYFRIVALIRNMGSKILDISSLFNMKTFQTKYNRILMDSFNGQTFRKLKTQ